MRTVLLFTLTLTACDPLRVTSLIPDADAKALACEAIQLRATKVVEGYDWQQFTPLFATKATPAEDEKFCRDLHEGVFILSGDRGQALGPVIRLPLDFDSRSPASRAALVCHEVSHSLWEKRVGYHIAAIQYATPGGRLGAEAAAYALGSAMLDRHGLDGDAKLERAAATFPQEYNLDPSCVFDYFTDVRAALRMAAGV